MPENWTTSSEEFEAGLERELMAEGPRTRLALPPLPAESAPATEPLPAADSPNLSGGTAAPSEVLPAPNPKVWGACVRGVSNAASVLSGHQWLYLSAEQGGEIADALLTAFPGLSSWEQTTLIRFLALFARVENVYVANYRRLNAAPSNPRPRGERQNDANAPGIVGAAGSDFEPDAS